MPNENIANIIKFLHPTADFTLDSGNVALADNGDGVVYISKWDLVASEPSIASLEAQEDDYLSQKALDDEATSDGESAVLTKLGITVTEAKELCTVLASLVANSTKTGVKNINSDTEIT